MQSTPPYWPEVKFLLASSFMSTSVCPFNDFLHTSVLESFFLSCHAWFFNRKYNYFFNWFFFIIFNCLLLRACEVISIFLLLSKCPYIYTYICIYWNKLQMFLIQYFCGHHAVLSQMTDISYKLLISIKNKNFPGFPPQCGYTSIYRIKKQNNSGIMDLIIQLNLGY